MEVLSGASVLSGNWIRRRIILYFALTALALAAFGAAAETPLFKGAFFSAAAVPAGMTCFLLFVYYQFSGSGGGLQQKLWEQTISNLEWNGDGTALDVGTGNGAIAILLAQKCPNARVIGIDPWPPNWEYSKSACEDNAARCGVAGSTEFVQASAERLPYDDETFDAVTSHFVFHEVRSAKDKFAVLVEALRVLKKGGAFSFSDMFYDQNHYSDIANRITTLELDLIELIDPRPGLQVPSLLKTKRVLGNYGNIRGTK